MAEMTMELITSLLIDSTESEDSFTSSSSESDDLHEIYLKLYANKRKRNCIRNYFEEVVPSYTNDEFIRHFRISRKLFDTLANKFKLSEEFLKFDKNKTISPEKHIAVFLWFAGHEATSFRDLADRFDLSLSTVSVIIDRITFFISNMADKTIIWPDEKKKLETSKYFLDTKKFPGIIGLIDGTKIIIDPPGKNKDDYVDRKNNYSISMQAICDESKKFIDVFIGFPGSCHDSRIFKNSEIFDKLLNMKNDYHILGDSAYPCRSAILTPYRDNGHLRIDQKQYNKIHSSCRVKIEHSFGILKQRFRQLYYCKLKGIKKICHFIRACCVLHNLAEINEVDLLEVDTNLNDINQDGRTEDDDDNGGKRKRDAICRLLQQNINN